MLFIAFKTFNLLLLSVALSQLNLVYSTDKTINSQENSVRASSKASFPNPRLQGLSQIGLKHEKDLTHELLNEKIKLEDVGNERVSRLSKQRQETERKYKVSQDNMSYFKHQYRELKHKIKELPHRHAFRKKSAYLTIIQKGRIYKKTLDDIHKDVSIHVKQGNLSQNDVHSITGIEDKSSPHSPSSSVS
jgi:hypothetical protein